MAERYIVISEDGRYVTLGTSAPSVADVLRAGADLRGLGLRGWIALASGSFHGRAKPRLSVVQPLNDPEHGFADAVAAAGGVVARLARGVL
jgi:hypothetical protein